MKWHQGLLVVSLTFLDWVTKWLVHNYLEYGKSVAVLGNFFRLTYIENPGISFGILSSVNSVYKDVIVFILAMIAIGIIIYLIFKSTHTVEKYAFLLILSGALGNVFERLLGSWFYQLDTPFYGKVIDFLDFGIGNHRFFVFNLADSFISIGVCILLLSSLFHKKRISQV